MDAQPGNPRSHRRAGPGQTNLQPEASFHWRRGVEGGQKAMIYADPSFLFSFYAWDDNTAAAQKLYHQDGRRPLVFTPWQRFELRNAVRLATLARFTYQSPVQPEQRNHRSNRKTRSGTAEMAWDGPWDGSDLQNSQWLPALGRRGASFHPGRGKRISSRRYDRSSMKQSSWPNFSHNFPLFDHCLPVAPSFSQLFPHFPTISR